MAQNPPQERIRARGLAVGSGGVGVGVVSVSEALRDLALCFLEDFFEESKVFYFNRQKAKRKPEKVGFAMGDSVCLDSTHG
jgi:hypothetical protein